MDTDSGEITLLLAQLGAGDKQAEARLLPALYSELHRIAASRLRGEHKASSLRPTELVNEAYLKLLAKPDQNWQNRTHFFATAAKAMRNILIDHIRTQDAAKRGGGLVRVEFDDKIALTAGDPADLLSLHEALERLEALDPDQARIVELRFFAGFTTVEIADLTGASVRTVEREWEYARNWLYRELTRSKSHGA